MELFKTARSKWHDWHPRSESDELPSNSQHLHVSGPIPKPPVLALMRGGRGSLRKSKQFLVGPQLTPNDGTTNTVHIQIPSNTQISLSKAPGQKAPTSKTTNDSTANKAMAPQPHAPITQSATEESLMRNENGTTQISEARAQSNIPSSHAPMANLQASLEDPTLIEYCSGFFVDPMAADRHPELQTRYNQSTALIRSFLISLQMKDPRVALEFVMASKTRQRDSAIATILITCLTNDQKRKIESGLHKQRNVIPAGFDIRIVVWKTVLSSRLTSTPSNPGEYAGKLVMASLARDATTLCGILGLLVLHDMSDSAATYFTLGGTIMVDGAVYVLASAHSLFKSAAIGGQGRGDDPTFRRIGSIYSYKFSGVVHAQESGDEDSASTVDEINWLGHDWALIKISDPQFYLPNSFSASPGTRLIRVNGHLNNDSLTAGKVSIISVNGVVNGILNGNEASMMIGNSYFTVRSIALETQLVDGDSGSWVIRDDKLCGYIFSRVVDSLWAYMLPIEPVFEDIGRTLRVKDSNSISVFPVLETIQAPPQVQQNFSREREGTSFGIDLPKIESSWRHNTKLTADTESSSSKKQQERVKIPDSERRYISDYDDPHDIEIDTQPTCLSPLKHDTNIRDPVLHYFGCLKESMRADYFYSLPEWSQQRITRKSARIEECRARFENQVETKALANALKVYFGRRRPEIQRSPRTATTPVDRNPATNKIPILADLGIKSNVIFVKSSEPYTHPNPAFQGEFPNQKIPLADLLDSNKDTNPLAWDCESDMIRYFHFPANNMSWIEKAMSCYYGEEASVRPKGPSFQKRHSRVERILNPAYWRTLQVGPNNEYSRYLKPCCKLLPRDSLGGEESDVILFMPYLHWETNAKRQRSCDRISKTTSFPGAVSNLNRSTFLKDTEEVLDKSTTQKRFRHQKFNHPLARALFLAAELYTAMDSLNDQIFLDEYLHKKPPLYPRRSLNQYNLWTSLKDDADQVVYRETRSGDDKWGSTEPSLIMVDQLWLWILDGNTVITSFPRRYGRNSGDSSNVSRRIRLRLKDIRTGEVNTAYDLALLIIDECSKTMFEPKMDVYDPKPQITDIFQDVIIRLGNLQRKFADHLLRLTKSITPVYEAVPSQDSGTTTKLLDLHLETLMGQDIELVSSDLGILTAVQLDQSHVIMRFSDLIRRRGNPVTSNNIRNIKKRVSDDSGSSILERAERHALRLVPLDELEQTTNFASAVYNSSLERCNSIESLQESLGHVRVSLSDTTSSRLEFLQLVQTRESMKQSKESYHQGRLVLLATAMVVIFLPLIFISSVFGMNAKELSTGLLSIREEFTIMFPVTFGIVVISLVLTFNSVVWVWFFNIFTSLQRNQILKKEIGKIMNEKQRDSAVKREVGRLEANEKKADPTKFMWRFRSTRGNDSVTMV